MCNTSHPAAHFCCTLNINGYTDWYLPSSGEMAFITNRKSIIEQYDEYRFLSTAVYWTSTQTDASNSRSHHYGMNQAFTSQDKMSNQLVRAIRRE